VNTPSYSKSGRGGQSGNPNVAFVFIGVLILFLALIVYVWTKNPASGTLLAQLPATAAPADVVQADEPAISVKNNPNGEALLEEILAKPLNTKDVDSGAITEKPADKQLVPESGVDDNDTTTTNQASPEDASKVKAQFSGTTEYGYTIKNGETLYGLASKFKVPAATIREMNAMTDNNLQSGKIFKMRIQGIHKVGAGEGLSGIARTYGVTVGDVRKVNGLQSDQLQPEQELIIPNR
jgi:LysM repeat protein